MIHYQKPIILMRPGAPNDRLAERLAKLGMNVWKWPAFTILPPEEPERVKERLSDLTNFDMVLLASPSAVAASAQEAVSVSAAAKAATDIILFIIMFLSYLNKEGRRVMRP